MTEEEAKREQEEADRLMREINQLRSRINSTANDNVRMEHELNEAMHNLKIIINNTKNMDNEVNEDMGYLMNEVNKAEINTSDLFKALNELSLQYFTFKNISTASKNMSQFTDEYTTKFYYYNELRRITLGYVIGIDNNIISSETLRKKVEKAYLQNTEYWLAYSITSVMLWMSDEEEAAKRAMSKSLSINYNNSCLFYLLINLRFNRVYSAKKWYVMYLESSDMANMKDEWQYLLQAYLTGAFGIDCEFQNYVMDSLKRMMQLIDVTNVDFDKKIASKAQRFAEAFISISEVDFASLKETCKDYDSLKNLLSESEKNAKLTKYFLDIYESEDNTTDDLLQRIENVLYDLVNNYDAEELEVIQKIKYNEAIISAKGNLNEAQENYNQQFEHLKDKKNFADLLIYWSFSDTASQTPTIVKQFSISMMKEWIVKGLQQFNDKYRRLEKDKVCISIDGYEFTCNEDDFEAIRPQLEQKYEKNKQKFLMVDKWFQIFSGLCILSLLMLGFMAFAFSKVIITIAVLLGIGASFLLWRRIVELGKILQEKKRLGVLKLSTALEELRDWRKIYKEKDIEITELLEVVLRF
jgi:hypothetical protein